MDKVKYLERKVERLEKRLEECAAHGRALERVVKNVIGDATKSAFEFAVKQYGWQELHDLHQKTVEEERRRQR